MSKNKKSFVTIKNISIKNLNFFSPDETPRETPAPASNEAWDRLPEDIKRGLRSIGIIPDEVVSSSKISDYIGEELQKKAAHAIRSMQEIHDVVHGVENYEDAVTIIAHIVCAKTGTMQQLVKATEENEDGLLTPQALDFVCETYKIEKPMINFSERKRGTAKQDESIKDSPIV